MSRGTKDLRELICVSRLTVRESDDEDQIVTDDEDGRFSRIVRSIDAMSISDTEGGSRKSSAASSRGDVTPDSGIGTNGHTPNDTERGSASNVNIVPHPPASENRPKSKRKKKKRQQNEATVPPNFGSYDLQKHNVLPPVKADGVRPSSSSGESVEHSRASSGSSIGRAPSHHTGISCDDMLMYLDATIVSEWLLQANDNVSDLTAWCHTSDNYVHFAHFWLSNFDNVQKTQLFTLEYSILMDHLEFAFSAGRDAGKIKHRDLNWFMEGAFREYPSKLLNSKGPHLFLDYLDILTSERQDLYKTLLSDVKFSTRIKQHAQWVLAVRSFALVSIWCAVVNFYRNLVCDSSQGPAAPIPLSMVCKMDHSQQRMYHSIRNGYLDVVHYLVKSKKVDPQWKDAHDRTLIFSAVMHDQPRVLKFLLHHSKPRPNVNQVCDTGNTALHAAANNGNVDLVTYLLQSPAIMVDPCNEQCDNATPLHLAAMHGHTKVVEVLLKHGADVNLRMGDLTVCDIAKDFEHSDILDILQAKMSNKR